MRKIKSKKIKKQRKIILAGIISITFILSIGYAAFTTNITLTAKGNIKDINLYVSSNGSDVDGDGTKEKPYQTIGKAYDAAPKKATIFIMDNITQTSTINMNSNKDITLTSYSTDDIINSVIRDSIFLHYMIRQIAGKLTFKNIIIDGQNIKSDYEMIYFNNSSMFIEEGTVIKNGNHNGNGGAIYLSTNANLTINGGTITNNIATNTGGGIYTSGGTINMTNGTISNNVAENSSGGGIYAINKTNITMSGGMIIKNTATTNTGGGVALVESDFNMTGGVISENIVSASSGVISLWNGSSFILDGGTIKNNKGYGIKNTGANNGAINTITIKSGVICENETASAYDTHQTCPSDS